MSGSFSPVACSFFSKETDCKLFFPDRAFYLAKTFFSVIDYYQNSRETYCLHLHGMCFGLTYCLLRQSRISTLKATWIMFQWLSSIQTYHVHKSKVPLIIAVSSGVNYICHTNSVITLNTLSPTKFHSLKSTPYQISRLARLELTFCQTSCFRINVLRYK